MHTIPHLFLIHPGWCHYSVLKTAPIIELNTCSLTLCNFIFSLSDCVIDICTGGNKTENVKALVTVPLLSLKLPEGWGGLGDSEELVLLWLGTKRSTWPKPAVSACLGWGRYEVWHLLQHPVWLFLQRTEFTEFSKISACCRTWLGMWRVSPWEVAGGGDRWRGLKCSLLTLLSDFHDSQGLTVPQ